MFSRIFLDSGAMTKKIRCLAETPEIDTVQEDVRRILPSVLDVFVELYFVSKCIRNCIRRKWGEKGAILGKNDRLGGISFSKMWYLIRKMLYLVPKMLYLAKSGNR